jgi:hypothetical protein
VSQLADTITRGLQTLQRENLHNTLVERTKVKEDRTGLEPLQLRDTGILSFSANQSPREPSRMRSCRVLSLSGSTRVA